MNSTTTRTVVQTLFDFGATAEELEILVPKDDFRWLTPLHTPGIGHALRHTLDLVLAVVDPDVGVPSVTTLSAENDLLDSWTTSRIARDELEKDWSVVHPVLHTKGIEIDSACITCRTKRLLGDAADDDDDDDDPSP